MTIAEEYLIEFGLEMKKTRCILERVQDEHLEYRPHPKSMTMRQLASHVAEMPGWGEVTANRDELDLNPPGGTPYEFYRAENCIDLMDTFDKNVVRGQEAVATLSNESMLDSWTMLAGGEQRFTMPRITVLKSMVLSHIIHHRAQLGVYLRMNDVPIPGMYGPSADEGMAG